MIFVVKNGYVTPREFQSAINRIDSQLSKIDEKLSEHITSHIKLEADFSNLKDHSNDSLEDTVTKKMAEVQYQLDLKKGTILVALTGVVTFITTWVIR